MGCDPNRGGYVPSRVPLMTLVGGPAQRILCTTSLVFAPQRAKTRMNPFLGMEFTGTAVKLGLIMAEGRVFPAPSAQCVIHWAWKPV